MDSALEQQLALLAIPLWKTCSRPPTIVSLHLPLTPGTQALIDEAALAKMRAGALLVNTARGEALDEAALRHALKAAAGE